ncbi:MAG: GAF domain-containing protein [Persicimonas sp.]
MYDSISHDAPTEDRRAQYETVIERIEAILDGVDDPVAVMATVACELHHSFEYYHWTGFYRRTGPEELTVGPYQGGHGCLHIDFARGVCGAAARTKATQLVDDVHEFPGHIACSSTTQSEIVVPVIRPSGELVAVLDVDSDVPAAFGEIDQECLERLCGSLGGFFRRAS